MRLPMNPAVTGLTLSGIRRFTALAAQTPGCVKLTLGEPEFDTPLPIRQAAQQALEQSDTHYPPNNGRAELLEALSAFSEKQGLHYAPEEFVVTCGATEALLCALSGVVDVGDEVLVPIPAFGLYESLIGLCRGVYKPVNTEPYGFQLSEEALNAAVSERTKAIILTSPNNPTGCVYTKESLDAVAELVRRTGIYVICDDVYWQLCYTDSFGRFAATYPDLRENIIVVESFSKPYAMTGWRLGWLAADAPVKQQLQKVHQYSVVSVTSFSQTACITALESDVSAMRQSYRQRRDYVYQRLCKMGLPVNKPEGAFYIFPCIRQFGMSSEEFCTRLIQESGLALVPGSCFGSEGYVRLSYCCAQDQLEEGLDRLEAFLNQLTKEKQ